jgi:hypothetical protein
MQATVQLFWTLGNEFIMFVGRQCPKLLCVERKMHATVQ